MILSNTQIYIKIVIQHPQNVNIIYLIRILSGDFQWSDKLKHVITLRLRRLFLLLHVNHGLFILFFLIKKRVRLFILYFHFLSKWFRLCHQLNIILSCRVFVVRLLLILLTYQSLNLHKPDSKWNHYYIIIYRFMLGCILSYTHQI